MKRQHVEIQQLSERGHRRRPRRKTRRQAHAGNLPRRQHRHPHGSALLPRRRCPARSPVLGAGRPAEASLRRHRLVLHSPLQSESRPRRRSRDPANRKWRPSTIPPALTGKISGTGSVLAVANTGQVSLLPLVYKLKGSGIQIADKAFDADGKHFAAGSLLITGTDDNQITAHPARSLTRRRASGRSAVRRVHAVTAPRIAFMHTWLGTRRLKAGGATPSTPPACPTTTSAPKPSPPRTTCARSTTSSSSRPSAALPR